MHKRLSKKKADKLRHAFNADVDKTARTTLKNLDIERYDASRKALKELIIACKRKDIKITIDGLSLVAQDSIDSIKAHIDKAHKKMHVKNYTPGLYSDITELPDILKASFKNAIHDRKETKEALNFFGSEDRVYFKFNTDVKKIKTYTEMKIANYLESKGYKIIDYRGGYATDDKGKQKFKIGKLLKEEENLQYSFNDDLIRSLDYSKFKKLNIVISRRPEDIQRMTISRAWESCTAEVTNGRTSQTRTIAEDLREGTLAVYLVAADDPEILDPISRILLKPYAGVGNYDTLFVPFTTYGIGNKAFTKAVERIVNKEINDPNAKGVFQQIRKMYYDFEYPKLAFKGSGIFKDTSKNIYHVKDDQLHRVDGPAVIYANGRHREWHINGEELSQKEFNEWRAEQDAMYNNYKAPVLNVA